MSAIQKYREKCALLEKENAELKQKLAAETELKSWYLCLVNAGVNDFGAIDSDMRRNCPEAMPTKKALKEAADFLRQKHQIGSDWVWKLINQ